MKEGKKVKRQKKQTRSELDSHPVRRRLHGGPQPAGRGDPFFEGPGDGGGGRDAEEAGEDPGFLEGGRLKSVCLFVFSLFFVSCLAFFFSLLSLSPKKPKTQILTAVTGIRE